MDVMKKIKKFCIQYPWIASVLFSLLAGGSLGCLNSLQYHYIIETGLFRALVAGLFAGGIILGGCIIYPIVLTVIEGIFLFRIRKNLELHKRSHMSDLSAIGLGLLYSRLYLDFIENVIFSADWQEQLVNNEKHTPINTHTVPTVIAIILVAIVGYFLVNFIRLEKMPPLMMVIGLASMYLGCALSIVWFVQIGFFGFLLILFPLNIWMITMRCVIAKVYEWKALQEIQKRVYTKSWLGKCNEFLDKSSRWPVAALILMWPLLGILILVLCLLGQEPDAVIKAWTETSEWTLSQRVSPQNVQYDMHYLCTVAAGGHKQVVKPLRMGVRHGHYVVVNRQLCIANAFEQVLEERIPHAHRVIRHIYDTYGLPIAKKIRTKIVADIVYYLMKPLEWFFLAVLYLVDVHPENRIAIQYTGKRLEDFKEESY